MKHIREVFSALGITAAEAARATGFPYPTVWRHLTGARGVSPEAALRYEAALGIPREHLRPDIFLPLTPPRDAA